uniref:Phosphatidylethanolamine-binding protein n=1 Tax=Clastoptera arizonana TaxID=38151 RepID=A0A1B6BZP3_9HEMI
MKLCFVLALITLAFGAKDDVVILEKYEPIIYKYHRYRNCYGSNLTVVSVPDNVILTLDNCTKYMDRKYFQQEPKVYWSIARPHEFFTLVLLDPNIKSYEPEECYLLWLVTNIWGYDLVKSNFTDAETIMPYKAPTARVGSGLHRYQFIIFYQRYKIKPHTLKQKERRMFRLWDWFLKNKQGKFKGPIAGVQFSTRE